MANCPNGHTSQSPDYCDVCGERVSAASSGPGSGSGPGASPGPPVPHAPPAPPGGGTGGGATACPDCGTPGTDRFCEACGYDFATGGGKPTPKTAPARPSQPAAHVPGPPGPGPAPGPPPPAPPVPQPPVPAPPVPAPPVPAPPVPAPPIPAPPVPGTAWTAVVTADRDYYDRVIAEEGPDSASLTFPPYAPPRSIPLVGQQIRIGRRSSSQPSPPEIDLREPPEDPGVSHVHAVLLAKPDGTWTLVDPGSTNRTCMNGSTEPIPYNVEVRLSDGDRIHVGAWTTITITRGEAT
ncbi:FHA domain-containing protein [Spirillospora sp. NPDC048819]|uniref:FHA domain-containing protein n=1 Tax=Spirillospora sp. NPDC048819 TaxID=3155268 RepID=UPI00340F5D17